MTDNAKQEERVPSVFLYADADCVLIRSLSFCT
jgi:hypothetical protein